MAVGRNDNYDLKIKKVQSSGRLINPSRNKRLSRLTVSGNVWGGSTSSDVSGVHNYDLKKKTYSRLAFGRNDNYDQKIKKVQLFGGCIITSGKKWLSHLAVSGNGWGGSTSLDVSAVDN